MYDGSTSKALKRDFGLGYVVHDSIYSPKFIHSFSPAIHANWSMYFNKIVFDIQMGLYIYNAFDRIVNNNWILEIELTKNFSLLTGLKSHFASADYVQFGLIWNILK